MTFVTIHEVVAFLNVKASTIYSWVHNGTIPYYKVNGLLRFDMEEIMEWVKNSKRPCRDSEASHKVRIPFRKAAGLDVDAIVKRTIEDARLGRYNTGKRETSLDQGLGREG